jgi:succinate dehydrogenase / fumarate reductase, cytochrome b subunit
MSSSTLNRGFLQTSVGKKSIVAITGALLLGFVVAHMLGNLQIFLGAENINSYAKTLQDLGGLLWVARIGLLVAFVAHIGMAIKITLENKAARPVPYAVNKVHKATLASRIMPYTGIVILAFVIYHLLHFTLASFNPEYKTLLDEQGRHDVYKMVIAGFSNPVSSLFYIIAQACLALPIGHLSHGIFSIFQTLGVNHPNIDGRIKLASVAVALVIFLGNSSIPVAVLLGILK